MLLIVWGRYNIQTLSPRCHVITQLIHVCANVGGHYRTKLFGSDMKRKRQERERQREKERERERE